MIRFDPDTVENGHIYCSLKEEEVFIYWVYLDIFCGYVRLRILWAGLIVFSNWIISKIVETKIGGKTQFENLLKQLFHSPLLDTK